MEGQQEPAAAPLYGSGQKAYTLACCVLGTAMHFSAQRINLFQDRLDYKIVLLLVPYVMSEGLSNKVIQSHGQETFFLAESMCVSLVFSQYEEVLKGILLLMSNLCCRIVLGAS